MELKRIRIFDTTLRDGEQSPGCSMNVREKLRLAHQLDRLGVDVIEAGFPIASDGDFAAVQAIAAAVRRPIIAGLARASSADIERAWQALRDAKHPRIHIFLATSDIHLKYKLRISRQQCLDQAAEAVRLAKTFCEDVEFSPEDATRSDRQFLCDVLAAVVEAGATTLNIPDTVGYTTPVEFGELILTIREKVCASPDVTISAHCHNDLGLAVANSLAAVAAGAGQVECTINGIGERAGNAALEEIVMAMRVRPDQLAYETGVATEHLYATSQMLSEITGVAVQPNKAIIGRNAFAHEAGIHQDGMLKNPLTYEIMTPQSVGVPDSTMVLGKHSGRHALGLRCEQLGFQFDRQQLDKIYRAFIVLADQIKHVEDHHLLKLINKEHDAAPAPTEVAIAAVASAGSSKNVEQPRATFAVPIAIPYDFNVSALKLHAAESHGEQEDYFWGV
ncbi:MAG TPA: 2-isopropylmalate synthase [Terriglobales bacterium]|jgi:2-isopropylmalate synthase|nr:2-isopropylmalate synthase [Terriglobales bacterium]